MAITIIAEVAQAHDGSLGRAHRFIDAVSDAGADAIKFQTHIAEYESSTFEPWRVKFSFQDKSRYDYWKRMEFAEDQWAGLIQHSADRKLNFVGTPFSLEGLSMLRRLGIRKWKLASGELTNLFLTKELVRLGDPVYMSTGMSTWAEIDAVAESFIKAAVPLTIMQCTSSYPVSQEQVGLNVISQIRDRYHVPAGLSDHSGKVATGIAAAALGAECIEVHVCFSRYDFGPDTTSSLTIEELKMLVDGVRQVETMLANPVNKDKQAMRLSEMHQIFTKSICAKQNLDKGVVIEAEMLSALKPCAGIPVPRLQEVLGKRTARAIWKGEFLQWEDLVE